MNKTEVTAAVAEKSGFPAETCRAVIDAVEQVSGNVLLKRMKGVKLDESEAVGEIAACAEVSEEDCKAILSALEAAFGEALSNKFRWL